MGALCSWAFSFVTPGENDKLVELLSLHITFLKPTDESLYEQWVYISAIALKRKNNN